MRIARRPYPSAASADEGALVAPWPTLLPEETGRREQPWHEVVDGLRCTVRTGALALDAPRPAAGRGLEPGAAVLDGRIWRSSPESGGRAGHDGAGRKRGSRPQVAVDTPGHLPALHVTPADADDPADAEDRARAGRLAEAVRAATGGSVSLACVDQGFSGPRPAAAAPEHGIEPDVVGPDVVGLPEAGHGVVLLPRPRVALPSCARITRSAASLGTTSPAPAPWHTSTWSPPSAPSPARPLHRPAVHDSR